MSTDSRGVTPYRATHFRFDLSEATLREPAFALWRTADAIAKGYSGQANSSNHHYLETNAIAIAPVQDDASNLHEKTDTGAAILTLNLWQVITGMVERNTFKAPTDLTGVTVDPSVQATGDPFIVKTVAAGSSWAQSLSADQTAFGQLPAQASGTNITYDRVAVLGSPLPGDTAFLIRAVVPGSGLSTKQTIGAFYFGGPIWQDPGFAPSGDYSIEFMGNGVMNLHMRVPDGSGGSSFKKIDSWQGFTRSTGAQIIHCRVWPHYAANGTPTIHFRTDTTSSAPSNGNLLTSYYAGAVNPSVHIWTGWSIPTAAMPVTGPGPIRVDHRRDIRLPFQVSVLQYAAPAYIQDDVFGVDFFPQVTAPFRFFWQSRTPAGTSVNGALYDANTGLELTQTGAGTNSKTYRLNPGQYHYFARFTLNPSPDGSATPYLYSYKVVRDAVYNIASPGEWSIPDTYPLAALRELSITGPDKDLTHETASATIEDPAANLAVLNTRARIRTRIETEYDPTDATKRSILFDGFLDRADGRKKGTRSPQGMGGAGPVRAFPSEEWKSFSCTFSGIWRRLREKLTTRRICLLADENNVDANGVTQPFKITDICRSLIYQCGFSPDQVDIPDDPRIFMGTGGGDDMVLEPLSEIGDVVASYLHDYLGWFLVWDANAGANGMVRAIVPPPLYGPYVPLANFTMDFPAGDGRFAHRPESYGSTNWVAVAGGGDVVIPTCFIRAKTFQTHVKPPEVNAVCVTGNGSALPNKAGQYQLNQWAWNPKSYDFFVDSSGAPIHTADPNHPDYLGEFIPLVVVNFSLGEQHLINILTRRLYDQTCHAQKWFMFEAPLCLVIDGNDPLQRAPRPLRYYDPVVLTKDGAQTLCIVRSANPIINRKDSYQAQHLELLAITLS